MCRLCLYLGGKGFIQPHIDDFGSDFRLCGCDGRIQIRGFFGSQKACKKGVGHASCSYKIVDELVDFQGKIAILLRVKICKHALILVQKSLIRVRCRLILLRKLCGGSAAGACCLTGIGADPVGMQVGRMAAAVVMIASQPAPVSYYRDVRLLRPFFRCELLR